MARVERTPAVVADIVEIALWIGRDSESAALRFIDAAERTFHWLAKSPEIGIADEFESPYLRGLRRWRIDGFERYLIFYRPIENGIRLVRVLHASRDIESAVEEEE